MKMLKKVTAVLVVLLLVLGTMSIGVSAEGNRHIGITITPDIDEDSYLYPGEIVTFTVNISTDFNYIAMRWPIMYTLKAFEPVLANDGYGDADYGNVIGIGDDTLANPDSYLESAEASTMEPFDDTYSRSNYGCLLVQWTGGTTGSGVTCYNEPYGADCFTFQLRVKSGYTANRGKGTVAIPTTPQAQSLFYFEGITNPADANTTFKLTSETCTVTSTPAIVNILKEQAGMVAKNDTVIDTESGTNYIYGFNPAVNEENEAISASTLLRYVTLTGNATFELIPLIEVPEGIDPIISTGAKMRLYDARHRFIDEYTFIIFGDINGDGVFDMMDGSMLIDGYLYMEDWTMGDLKDNPTFFSCDINGDGEVASDDFGPLMEVIVNKGYINQTNDPDNFFEYFVFDE